MNHPSTTATVTLVIIVLCVLLTATFIWGGKEREVVKYVYGVTVIPQTSSQEEDYNILMDYTNTAAALNNAARYFQNRARDASEQITTKWNLEPKADYVFDKRLKKFVKVQANPTPTQAPTPTGSEQNE